MLNTDILHVPGVLPSGSVISQYSPIPDEYLAKTKPLIENCDLQWFSIYFSYLSSLDIAFKMSNRSKQARIVPETPDNSSSDDEQEQEGEELQVGDFLKNIWEIFEKY